MTEWLIRNFGDEMIVYDGLDDAVVGVVERIGTSPAICYDQEKVLDLLMKDGMTFGEAVEFFDHNIGGLFSGERTPYFLTRYEQ